MVDPDPEAVARNRWAVMTAVRMAGVAMVVAGVMMLRGVIPGPDVAAYLLLAVGLVDTFVVPQVLARKWRTPRP